MPTIGMQTESWKTERSASQPLSPLPPSPFPPSPIPSPASNPSSDLHSRGLHHGLPYYSPPPTSFSLNPPSSRTLDLGVVPPIEVSLLPSIPFPIPLSLPDGRPSSHSTSAAARSIYSSDGSDDGSSPHSTQSTHQAVALLWPSPALIRIPLERLRSLSFNCFDYSSDQLLLCTVDTLDSLNLVTGLSLSLPHLQTFLLSIRAHYRVNPYHDFVHGFAVFQFGYYMLTESRLRSLLTPHDQLVLLISCLCHDVDHPGTTNSFQVAMSTGLARIHNDVAVLENHHAFVTCEMMRHEASNFLPQLSATQFRAFRKMVVQAILATDMAVHFDLCKEFNRLESDLGRFKGDAEADRQLVINVLTHSSDLSAQVMDFPIAQAWEERVTREFTNQWRLERSLGQVETPHMMNLHEPTVRYKNHLGFLDHVMQPLWSVVSDVLPPMSSALSNLLRNRQQYDLRLSLAKGPPSEEEIGLLPHSALPSSSAPSSNPISVDSSAFPSPSITQSHSPVSLSPHQRTPAMALPPISASSTAAYQALREEAPEENGAEDAKFPAAHSNKLKR